MRDPESRRRARARLSWAKALRVSAPGILLAVVTACGGTSVVSPVPSPSAVATPSISPSTALPSPSPGATSATKQQKSIAIDGDERVVDLFVPSIPAGRTAPLLVLLHGNGESPFLMAQA